MDQEGISLTQAEWSVMECLWAEGPLTGREVTARMEDRCGWSRSTTLTPAEPAGGQGGGVRRARWEGPQGVFPRAPAGGRRPAGD